MGRLKMAKFLKLRLTCSKSFHDELYGQPQGWLRVSSRPKHQSLFLKFSQITGINFRLNFSLQPTVQFGVRLNEYFKRKSFFKGWCRRTITTMLLTGILFFYSPLALTQGQSREGTQDIGGAYLSQADKDLTIRRIAILPVVDNVGGIYARPIETQLVQLLKSSHRWDYVESNIVGAMPTVIELEENSAEVQRVTQSIDADAFIAAVASRGPKGLSIRLDLFLKKDGKILSQEILKDHARYELPEVRERVNELYKKMSSRIPYNGILLSREGNRVTINLGKSDGLTKDQVVTVVQIISLNRHPKFHFLISSEKEILGRVKILKVDETLSFGAIIAEKERGAIRKFAKIAGLEQVTYPEPSHLGEGAAAGDVSDRPDAAVTFGKDPKEWLPVRPPSFGQVGAKIGIGNYNSSVNVANSGDAKSPFYPSIGINGEIWLTPQWIVRAELGQGVLSTDNPRPGSAPGSLSHSMSKYSLEGGYNFLLRDDFFGPKMYLSAGFASYRMYVDSSSPTSLTTVNYSGLMIGFGGSFPVTENKVWYLGGRFNLYMFVALSESPVSSGGEAKNSINDFSLFLEKRIAENLRATASVDFSLYSTSFTGAGTRTGPSGSESATSLSQRHTNITGGISYMF